MKCDELWIRFADDFLGQWEKRLNSRGLVDTLKHYKLVRLCFTRYLSGTPLEDSGIPTVQGWPLDLISFKKVFDELRVVSNDDYFKLIRLLMTILTIGKSFKTKPELDVSTIVEPSKARDILLTELEAKTIARKLKLRVSSCD